MDFDRSFFGYPDDRIQSEPLWLLRRIGRMITYAGMFFYMLEIRIPKWLLLTCLCVFNFLLLLPSLWMPFRRYGPDFTAYVNQAGQFASGQTVYPKLSSIQGQCFYPAGHLYHYVPVYHLFLATDKAEYIWKTCHFVFHSIINYFVARLSFTYFTSEPHRAQLICFLLLGNEQIREFNQHLFNDTFLAMYIIICIYLLTRNRPVMAALFLTLSLSVKAGAMLMVPSFFAWVHYFYGTKTLVMCLFVTVMF